MVLLLSSIFQKQSSQWIYHKDDNDYGKAVTRQSDHILPSPNDQTSIKQFFKKVFFHTALFQQMDFRSKSLLWQPSSHIKSSVI